MAEVGQENRPRGLTQEYFTSVHMWHLRLRNDRKGFYSSKEPWGKPPLRHRLRRVEGYLLRRVARVSKRIAASPAKTIIVTDTREKTQRATIYRNVAVLKDATWMPDGHILPIPGGMYFLEIDVPEGATDGNPSG